MNLHKWTAVFLLAILFNNNRRHHISACGQLQNVLESRITFGHDTHRWPWHAAIYQQYKETEFTYKCGGTLVSSKFVLTAAHCVSVEAEQISVSLGRLYLNESPSSVPFIKVAEILAHPEYSSENFENDIAVITLVTDAIFNSYVQPVCMWSSNKIDLSEVIGKFGTVVGWGVTEDGETSNVLQEASLPVVPYYTCLKSNRDLFGSFLTSTNFCAGTQNGTSVCTGDSGGSITFQDDGMFHRRGIVSVSANKLVDRSSHKFMCDSMQYAVFTDVAQYLPWIREKVECVVQCSRSKRHSEICTVVLTVAEFGCKIIFEENSSVAVKELSVTGDWTSAVPDLSSAVEKFMELEKLSLYKFTHVERHTLSAFKNIIELRVYNFTFTQIDADSFVDLNNLETIAIYKSNLTNLPAGIFRNNNKIRDLYLLYNHLLELHSDVFENLRNVEKIAVEVNRLNTLPSNIFRNNKKLTILRISYNSFRTVHVDLFRGLTNLRQLDLSENQIGFLPRSLFSTNAKLAFVFLKYNRIKVIEFDLTTMPQLIVFELKGNACMDEDFDFRLQSLSEANDKIHQNCVI